MFHLNIITAAVLSLVLFTRTYAQDKTVTAPFVSKAWVSDNGDGTYKNPVINADYSDPDVVRAGSDYYLVSSSFEAIPGLPVLHSTDMINWKIIGHALKKQPPFDHYNKPQRGNGVWAPAIRYHKGEFYIYYPDPDFGIYVTKATNPAGPWSDPVLVEGGKGLIDPCPLWDDNGEVYLVHALAGSRASVKSIIIVKKLNKEGTRVTGEGVIVFDGHETDPTIEGPKFYKRNGYYYIFAPAGGVSTGWQLVLRSKNIYGPYERKVVMDQGSTTVNGPHQGAWVTTPSGEDWFFHFQDKDQYGRVVHLQPMKWVGDWPVIGADPDKDGKGEPVMTYKKPAVNKTGPIQTPADSDEFNGQTLGLQWQWQANSQPFWAYSYPAKGVLRLYSYKNPDTLATNLWEAPNVLSQKFPADAFTATTRMSFNPNEKITGEKAGLAIMGLSYANLALERRQDGIYLIYTVCRNAGSSKPEKEEVIGKLDDSSLFLRVTVGKGALCQFSYSTDGTRFTDAGAPFQAQPGKWIGAKVGIFCTRPTETNDSGYADFDWFRVGP